MDGCGIKALKSVISTIFNQHLRFKDRGSMWEEFSREKSKKTRITLWICKTSLHSWKVSLNKASYTVRLAKKKLIFLAKAVIPNCKEDMKHLWLKRKFKILSSTMWRVLDNLNSRKTVESFCSWRVGYDLEKLSYYRMVGLGLILRKIDMWTILTDHAMVLWYLN